MFRYREIDYKNDLDQIHDLINNHLDPTFTKKLFQKKHLQNPFGRSLGIVALHEDRIIGLRMGMKWQLVNGENGDVITAARPVDTVVHEDYRKQGIFRKMNEEFLKLIKNNYDCVFNTPNEKSFPGNMKMGWKLMEDRKYCKVGIVNPFSRHQEWREISLEEVRFQNYKGDTGYITNFSDPFIVWRYSLDNYYVASFNNENSFCIIYKKVLLKGLKAVAVVEILGDPNFFSSMVNSLAKKHKSFFVYFLDHSYWQSVNFLATIKRYQPNVLYRGDHCPLPGQIRFSLGDLEAII